MTLFFKRAIVIFFAFINDSIAENNVNETILAEHKKLNVQVVSEIYPPYQVMNDKEELQGWAADKVKAIFDKASVDYNVKIYPWARAYQLALTKPNVFIFSLLRTEEREHLFLWIAPLCLIEFSFYRLKKRSDIKVNNLEEAKKYLIAAQKGQASAEYLLSLGFEPEKNLSVSYNNDNFIQMLAFGRVELIVLSSSYFQSLVDANSPFADKIEPVFPLSELTRNLYLASSINSSPELIKRLEHAYHELVSHFDNTCNE